MKIPKEAVSLAMAMGIAAAIVGPLFLANYQERIEEPETCRIVSIVTIEIARESGIERKVRGYSLSCGGKNVSFYPYSPDKETQTQALQLKTEIPCSKVTITFPLAKYVSWLVRDEVREYHDKCRLPGLINWRTQPLTN